MRSLDIHWQEWLLVAAVTIGVLLLIAAAAMYVRARRRVGIRVARAARRLAPLHHPSSTRHHRHKRHRQQVAVVVNPIKDNAAQLVEAVRLMCSDAALPAPLIFETTVEDTGAAQARAALRAGADVVAAAGGDGTVRAVASAMIGTGVPMALLPAGTGNLLARNLDLPIGSVDEAMAVVLGGRERHIDVGWARVTEAAKVHPLSAKGAIEGDTQLFLVIAGLGFDAAMVAETDDDLKHRFGWIAYFLAGVRHLHDSRLPATIWLDDHPAVRTQLRSAMIGNCGILPGNITLIPEARIDDGVLDAAVVDTRAGMVGWTQLLGEVVLQGAGVEMKRPGKIGH
ncbi:MAG: diacylglycerol kinase, partial [Cellulomonadaceae bacterium]|nr:diacylglycerol kinase [Cellulomonadaceae bacterium]